MRFKVRQKLESGKFFVVHISHTNKVNIPLDAFFVFFTNIIIATVANSKLSTCWSVGNDQNISSF